MASDPNEGMLPWLIFIVTILGWAIDRIFVVPQKLKQAKTSTLASEAEVLSKLHHSRDEWQKTIPAMDLSLQRMIFAFNQNGQDSAEFSAAREDFSAQLCNEAIPKWINRAEFEMVFAQDSPESLRQCVQEQLLPDCRRVRDWRDAMNRTEMTRLTDSKPLRVSKSTLNSMKRLTIKYKKQLGVPLCNALNQSLNELLDSD